MMGTMWLPWIITSGLASIVLFVFPFHLDKPDRAATHRPRSLLGIVRRERHWSRGGSLKKNLLTLGFCLSLCVVFLPPALLWQLSRLSGGAEGGLRFVIIMEAIALLLGCAMTIIAIALSDMTIGFGTPVRQTRNTALAWLIPIYEIGFALGAIAGAMFIHST